MNKMLVAGISIIVLAMVVVGYAAYMIFSPTVTVNVGSYRLTLDANPLHVNQNDTVTLTARLYSNEVAVGSGFQIHFYQETTDIGTVQTNSTGYAVYQWVATTLGSYNFKVGYTP